MLEQLKERYFSKETVEENNDFVSSTVLMERWRHFANDFRHNSGEDFNAKWDVFAECLIRLPINRRFVDYSRVEVE